MAAGEEDEEVPRALEGGRKRQLKASNVWAEIKLMAKQAGSTIMETGIKMPVMEQKPMKLPNIPLPVPLKEFKEKVISSYKAVEAIPRDATAADLLLNNKYVQGKINGIAGALNVNPTTIKILGFELEIASSESSSSRKLLRILAALAETQQTTVQTNYEVAVVDQQAAR